MTDITCTCSAPSGARLVDHASDCLVFRYVQARMTENVARIERRREQRATGLQRWRNEDAALRWWANDRDRGPAALPAPAGAARELAAAASSRPRAGPGVLARAARRRHTRLDAERGRVARRKLTVRTHYEDGYRWRKHVAPFFGRLRPGEVDVARIRAFVEAQLRAGVNPATIRIHVSLLASLFADLVERGIAPANPARGLPRQLMRMMRPTHDPRTTPFLEKLEDVRRVYLKLQDAAPSLAIGFAIGALAGLRTGEVFALQWRSVDLASRRILVSESVKGPTKDRDPRPVPILDALLPILTAWKLETGGKGLVVPPLRCDGNKVDRKTPGKFLREALRALDLEREGLGWYECTRHTFASQWVMNGGSIEKLKEILGHYSVVMTERYAHLRVDLFTPKDLGTIAVDLSPGGGQLVRMGPEMGPKAETPARKLRKSGK